MREELESKCLRDANLRDGSTQPKYVNRGSVISYVSSAALAFRSLWRDERESMNCTWLLERLTSVAPKKAVSMATPHSPAVRPAADCEFLQGQKERNSSVHLVKRNVLPFIRETAGLCGYMKEWFTHPLVIRNVDEFISSSDLEK